MGYTPIRYTPWCQEETFSLVRCSTESTTHHTINAFSAHCRVPGPNISESHVKEAVWWLALSSCSGRFEFGRNPTESLSRSIAIATYQC